MRSLSDPALRAALIALALGMLPVVAVGDDAQDPFDVGVELTQAGRFEEALEQFGQSRALGDDSGRLQFNIGVVHYRLQQLDAAREAFALAAEDPETAELARYNLGLVAMAAGDSEDAVFWFRRTAAEAHQSELRALARAALERALEPPVPARGSLTLLRGSDSNVVVPVGALTDAPSSTRDAFWETRLGWSDELDDWFEGLGYHLSGLYLDHDEVSGADLSALQFGVDWRGPITLDLSGGVLAVDDEGYQRTLELRALIPLLSLEDWRVSLDLSAVELDSISARAEALDGQQHGAGLMVDGRAASLNWNLSARQLHNDRDSRALSPVQDLIALRLRVREADWAARGWARYIGSDYAVDRRDVATEFGLGLSWFIGARWELVIDATQQRNRSNIDSFEYTSNRVYGGLRVGF